MGNPLRGLKDKSKVLDVVGNIKDSPFCKMHLAEITRYCKSPKSEKWVLDQNCLLEVKVNDNHTLEIKTIKLTDEECNK